MSEGLENLTMQMDYPEHRGSIVVGAYPDLVLNHLPSIVKEFRDQFPQVQIKLAARSYAPLIEMVLAGDLDIGLGTEPEPHNPSVEFKYLYSSNFVVVTPLDHELLNLPNIALEDIARWPLILLGQGSHSRRTLEQAFKRRGLEYSVTLEMDIMEMVKRYVEIDMGISVTHEYAVQDEDTSKLGIRDLSGILPSTRMGLLTLKGKFLSRPVRDFSNTLVARLGDGTEVER